MNCYKDPKFEGRKLKKKGNKIAIVIPLYVGKEGREDYVVLNEAGEWYSAYKDNKLDNIKFTMACHKHFDAGMDYELILVDNSTDDEGAKEYYKTLPYKLYERENNGFSFGAYKWFWENNNDYDYYLFHEQDFAPCKDGWLKEIYDLYQSDPEIGAVGNVMEYRDTDDPAKDLVDEQIRITGTHRNHIINLDGAFTFTSKEVLQEVDRIGGFKVLDGKVKTSSFNELLFTQPILELGYKMAAFGNREFSKTDRIHFYGSRKGNLTRVFNGNKLAPIVDGITRITCEQMKQYFNARNIA